MKKPASGHAGTMTASETASLARSTALRLLAYCRARGWAGYDPYDALNGRLLRRLPILTSGVGGLIVTQAVKRAPLNLRPLLLVPPSPNTKGTALFLSAVIRLTRSGAIEPDETAAGLAQGLLAMRSPAVPYPAWGYPFDWQTRFYRVPKWSPNIICSTFAANAFMDLYEDTNDPQWLSVAAGTAEFLVRHLFWREDREACFSYTPFERTRIHNANLLGAALLCRVGRAQARPGFIETGLDAARTSVGFQRPDGSWPYGELPTQQWVDNFHTGFNLTALRQIGRTAGTAEFESAQRRGYGFYRAHFFTPEGMARYYRDATYPIDIHSIAQSLITLQDHADQDEDGPSLARSVLQWAMANMWNPQGYFSYQRRRFYTIRTSFMRWSQAWMLLALTALLPKGEP